MNRYDLFGMTFESPAPIPGLVVAETRAPPHEPPIRIVFGTVPPRIEEPEYADASVQVSGSQYLFSYPGVLRLLVDEDQRIVVEPEPGGDPGLLWATILGIGGGAVGFRRGHISLHAGSVLAGGGCVAFAGQSGAGKSTLAAALVQRGYPLFTDDHSLVRFGPDGALVVSHGPPDLRLLEDAVAALGWSGVTPFATLPASGKTVFRPSVPSPATAVLRRIYVLGFEGEGAGAGLHRLEGVAALQALIGCLRLRPGLLGVGPVQRTFERLGAIAERVEMFRFIRPRDHAKAPAWIDRLQEHFES